MVDRFSRYLSVNQKKKKKIRDFLYVLSGSLWLRQPKVKVVFDDRTQTKASRALLSIRPMQEKHRKNFRRHLVGAMALKAGRPISQWKMTFWEKQCHEAIFWARKLIFSDFKPLTMIQIKTGTNFWFFDFKVSNHAHGVKTRILDYYVFCSFLSPVLLRRQKMCYLKLFEAMKKLSFFR